MNPRQRLRGVTLIEASIVTAISAVVVSASAPGFQSFIEKQRLDGVAAQLASDVRFTRAEAVLGNTGLRLSVHPTTWGSCYVIHTGLANDCRCTTEGAAAQCTGEARQIRTVSLPAAQGIAVQSNVASILFDPQHGTSTPTGTLKVAAASGRAVHHVVNLMGRVRTCSPQGAAPAVSGYRVC